jgi:hypothetical protein
MKSSWMEPEGWGSGEGRGISEKGEGRSDDKVKEDLKKKR